MVGFPLFSGSGHLCLFGPWGFVAQVGDEITGTLDSLTQIQVDDAVSYSPGSLVKPADGNPSRPDHVGDQNQSANLNVARAVDVAFLSLPAKGMAFVWEAKQWQPIFGQLQDHSDGSPLLLLRPRVRSWRLVQREED